VRTTTPPNWAINLAKERLVTALTEKRRHPRIPLRLPTEYFPPGGVHARLCYTINISENGVLLCLPEKMNVGDRLRVEIYCYFEYDLTCFEAIGEVVWVKKVEDSEVEYLCALEFVELAPAASENLKRFLRKIFY
jgi:c-di-GMP-binding flagellar brake protein YcgR